jgi:tRNA A58 N-methylase Trm61
MTTAVKQPLTEEQVADVLAHLFSYHARYATVLGQGSGNMMVNMDEIVREFGEVLGYVTESDRLYFANSVVPNALDRSERGDSKEG